MITGFHAPRDDGVIFLIAIARKVGEEISMSKGAVFHEPEGHYEMSKSPVCTALRRSVWVFHLALFYLCEVAA